MSPSDPPKTCPRCGTRFACGQNACWCAAITLSPETRAQLRAQYAGCLCPQCLRDFAARDCPPPLARPTA